MEVQAIDQTIFPSVMGKTILFYCPQSLTSGNITLWSFPIPQEKYFDLFPALPLNNCILSYIHAHNHTSTADDNVSIPYH